ncbi:MAG TPA: two-component regulator propeller domain-containing protein, partial [Verrucomicrobiae bacterium]|nr:two-component regulator propeller domain-containing protein [Verrucomicrobiae bacterium]
MTHAWHGRRIISMAQDKAGDIWILGVNGWMARVRDGLILPPAVKAAAETVALARDTDGTIWVLESGSLFTLENDHLKPVEFSTDAPDTYVQGVCASRKGGVWVARGGRLRRYLDARWVEDLGATPWGVDAALAFIETRQSGVVAGIVDRGVYMSFPDRKTLSFSRTNGLPSDWVRALCEDREGNLWIGTGNGLVELHAGKVTVLNPPDQWQGHVALSVCAAKNNHVWIGTEGAGLYDYHDGNWARFGVAEGISNLFVWSVSQDAQGTLWAGTWGGGLLRKRDSFFEIAPGLENVSVPMVAQLHAENGDSWIGTGSGLMHYKNARATWYGLSNGLAFPDVRTIARDKDGTIWFGMLGGGLGKLKNGKLKQFRKADGLSSDFVQCLRFDEEGVLWIGTFGGGLDRLKDGRFSVISVSNGIPNDIICDIEDDGRGNFWFSSHAGIFRVSKEDLRLCADGRTNSVQCLTLGKGDGLPTLECSGGSQPAGCRTEDGRLWFPTSKGLVVVDPDNVKINHLPPPVVIEQFLVDGKNWEDGTWKLEEGTNGQRPSSILGSDSSLQIPPGHNRFEFRYAALSFVAPQKVQFKYRLEGLETDWVDAGAKRSVPYNFLPPGRYVFHVIACNNDGIWNETGASFAFTVMPHFWQTWWFRVLAALFLMGIVSGSVWSLARRRLRLRVEKLERQRAVERERARIAKDIHDDLGASLTRIVLLSQSALLDSPPHTAIHLDRIYSTARDLTRAMDEIVWAVNPQHDTLDSLATYLGKLTQDYLGAAGIRCRLDVPMHLPAWPLTAEVRHNLFLAVKEALHNVVKHSGATEVGITLAIQPDGFVLTVSDNGKGFDVNATREITPEQERFARRGNGLANMRQRLGEIGGECRIKSFPGEGTTVSFSVKVAPQHSIRR